MEAEAPALEPIHFVVEAVPVPEAPLTPIEPVDEYFFDEYPVEEYPADEYPLYEYPADEYPTDEYPTDEHPVDEYLYQDYSAEEGALYPAVPIQVLNQYKQAQGSVHYDFTSIQLIYNVSKKINSYFIDILIN